MSQHQVRIGGSGLRTISMRGIPPALLSEKLQLLNLHFGELACAEIFFEPLHTVAAAATFSEKGSILGELTGSEGLEKVIAEIRNHNKPSFHEPEGAWFQLLVANVLKRMLYDVSMEASIGSLPPKDILVRNLRMQVECKAFVRAAVFDSIWDYQKDCFDRISPLIPDGVWTLNLKFDWNKDPALRETAKFTISELVQAKPADRWNTDIFSLTPANHERRLIGDWENGDSCGIFGKTQPDNGLSEPYLFAASKQSSFSITGPQLDEFRRIYSAIAEKRRQMVDGWCNLIAIDTSSLAGNVHQFHTRLIDAIAQEAIDDISGILFLSSSRTQHFLKTQLTFLTNPAANNPCSAEVQSSLNGELYWT